MKPILIFLFLIVSLYAYTAEGQRLPDIKKLRKREVADIRFEGDSNISALELQSIIATRTSGSVERFLNGISSTLGTPRQFIDEGTLNEDTIRIFVYYRDRGFFDVHVSHTEHESPESAQAWESVNQQNNFLPPENRKPYPFIQDTVIFHITEGRAYRVSGFTFEGFESLPMDLQSKLTENIGIKPKSQYSKDALIQEIAREKEILGENGYPFFSLASPLVEPDTVSKTVTVSLKFKTGPRIRLGNVRLVYDTAYSASGHVLEKVVRRQLDIDSGAWYKNSDRLASIRDVGRLGTFQYVNIELDTSVYKNVPDSLRNGVALPVILNLRMREPWELSPGLYAGISPVFNQFIFGVSVSYTNRNIFLGAENFTFQGSYQFFPSTETRLSLSPEFVLPYFLVKNVPLIVSLGYSYASEVNRYLEEVGSLNLGTNIELSGDPSFRITDLPKLQGQYVLRNYYDSTLRPMDTSSIQPSQLNSVFSNDLAFNWTDDPRNPTHGSYIRWSSQWAFPALKNALQSIFPKFASLASAAYIKNTIEFKTFFNLTTASRGRSVMAFRIMGGMIGLTYPSDLSRDVLLENRYYGGGTSSLRGWPSRSLLVSNNTDSARPYYGGYKTFETNLEWRYALFQYPAEITAMQQFLSAVHIGFFCDAGNVWDKDVPVALKNVAIAVGTGLRYYTLFGAVRVDFGFKFYDPYPSSPQNGLYSIPPNYIGGVWLFNRKGHVFHDTYNIEFALGQAF